MEFPESALVERLCGFSIEGECSRPAPEQVEAFGKVFNLGDQNDGLLRMANVRLGANASVVLQAGDAPLVAEHRLGNGRVYTFTTPDHFGHRSLLPLAQAWAKDLLDNFPLSVKLHGGEGEVAYFVYPEDKGKRIYLVNTDWTKAGNVKHCRIEADGVSREIDVREGEVAEVVVQGLPAPESGDGEVIENAP